MRFWKPTLCVKNRPATRFDLTRKEQAALRRELETSMCADEFCRRLFHCLRQALKPDRYLVEKTPTNVFEVPRIHEIYPRAKLLAIVRDGRDVVVSEKFMLANLKRGITFRERVLAWRKAMEAHLKYEKDFGLYTFSYRQFLENGVGTLRGLLDFMGLVSFPDLLLDVQRRSSFEFITGRKNGHERSKEFFRKGIHGDWVNHFTTDEKKVFKDLAGDMLVRLGFESNNNW